MDEKPGQNGWLAGATTRSTIMKFTLISQVVAIMA